MTPTTPDARPVRQRVPGEKTRDGMSPYYEDETVTLYCGDARGILPHVPATVIVSDPVWPNAKANIVGIDRPFELFAEIVAACPASVKRAAFQLGCDSDPVMLAPALKRWPLFRVAWLEYVRPHYKGRLLYTSDIGYLMGEPPPVRPGQFVIPGKTLDTSDDGKQGNHPCPRKLSHVAWLVKWWSGVDDVVCDPQCGSGTTLRVCKDAGRRVIGIEIDEAHCEEAVRRMAQGVLPFGTVA